MSDSLPNPASGPSSIFWGELAPSEHIAQFYETDEVLIQALAAFVHAGLARGESVIVIATPGHLEALQAQLTRSGIDLKKAILEDRYIVADAETALASFMFGSWPDDRRFGELIGQLVSRATVQNRRVRAFGEMVALLWARGDVAATVRLEHLWNDVCEQVPMPLFCAYPKVGSTMEPSRSIAQICAAHSRVMGAEAAAAD